MAIFKMVRKRRNKISLKSFKETNLFYQYSSSQRRDYLDAYCKDINSCLQRLSKVTYLQKQMETFFKDVLLFKQTNESLYENNKYYGFSFRIYLTQKGFYCFLIKITELDIILPKPFCLNVVSSEDSCKVDSKYCYFVKEYSLFHLYRMIVKHGLQLVAKEFMRTDFSSSFSSSDFSSYYDYLDDETLFFQRAEYYESLLTQLEDMHYILTGGHADEEEEFGTGKFLLLLLIVGILCWWMFPWGFIILFLLFFL